jgi:hypothetical protein
VHQNVIDRALELERCVRERADIVKRELREYRETLRSAPRAALLKKKQLDVQRANAEYMKLRKELDQLGLEKM